MAISKTRRSANRNQDSWVHTKLAVYLTIFHNRYILYDLGQLVYILAYQAVFCCCNYSNIYLLLVIGPFICRILVISCLTLDDLVSQSADALRSSIDIPAAFICSTLLALIGYICFILQRLMVCKTNSQPQYDGWRSFQNMGKKHLCYCVNSFITLVQGGGLELS